IEAIGPISRLTIKLSGRRGGKNLLCVDIRSSAFPRSSVEKRSPWAMALYPKPRPCATFNEGTRLSAPTIVRRLPHVTAFFSLCKEL
ncbi:MAG: hypothetical protein ABSC32_22610, partial [Steroidobacteraceae bacterium]